MSATILEWSTQRRQLHGQLARIDAAGKAMAAARIHLRPGTKFAARTQFLLSMAMRENERHIAAIQVELATLDIAEGVE